MLGYDLGWIPVVVLPYVPVRSSTSLYSQPYRLQELEPDSSAV